MINHVYGIFEVAVNDVGKNFLIKIEQVNNWRVVFEEMC